MKATPTGTVVGLVTPHLLRVVDLATQAEQGVVVDWHVRESVARSMDELGDLFNASVTVSTYIDGLEDAAGKAPKHREAYIRTLETAAEAARRLRRD